VGSGDDRQQVAFGVALASAVAQVGCVTVVVILGALAVGLALDDALQTRPLFTLVLVLASVPVSLYLLVRIALSAAAQATPAPTTQVEKEPPDHEEESSVSKE
jgi:F0F1-type ATP synthase assembly protein I